MERFANNIAEIISMKLNYNDEKKSVIAYGLAAIFQVITIFVITSIIGLFYGFWLESVIIFLSVGNLRRSTGGAHSQTFIGCLIISIFSICLLSILARYLIPTSYRFDELFLIPIVLVVYAFSLFVIYKKAPVDTPNKPIIKIEKIKKLRLNSMITTSLYFIISLILVFLSDFYIKSVRISLSFCLATLWQVFTLTKPGHIIIDMIDKKFR